MILLVLLVGIIPFIIPVAGVSAAPPEAAAVASVPYRRTLPSGLHLIVWERSGATVTAIDLRVRAGSAQDDPAAPGAAHFVEHTVFKGTPTQAPGDCDRAIEAIGGEITARTFRDQTQYAVSLPHGDTATCRAALETLAPMLLHPAFRPDDVEAERPVIRAEMAYAASLPARMAYTDLAAAVWPASDPAHLPVMGTGENVARLTPDDLRAFCNRWYRPDNMTLVVVGNVRAADVESAATALFPPSPATPAAPATPAVIVTQAMEGIVRAPVATPSAQVAREAVTVTLGFPAPGANEADTLPILDVLLPLLATSDGRGRVASPLIEKQHLAYAVTADYSPGRVSGLLTLSATGPRGSAKVLEALITEQLERIADEPITDTEVADARALALSDARYNDTTATGTARRLALFDALGVAPDQADKYAARLAAVTTDDVKRAARRILTWSRYAVTVSGGTLP